MRIIAALIRRRFAIPQFLVAVLLAPVLFVTSAHADGPPLWRVKTDNATLWIFGSVHLLPEGVDWQGQAALNAFETADKLVLEVAPPRGGAAPLLDAFRDYGYYVGSETLADALSDADYQRVAETGEGLGLPERAIRKLKPWYASLLLAARELAAEGVSADRGVESILSAAAVARGLPISGLESPRVQMHFLSDLRRDTQVALLLQTIDDIETRDETLKDIADAWLSGDEARMEEAFLTPLRAYPDLYTSLIVKRNLAWTRRIDEYSRGNETVFIAVGAAHLIGEDSVIALLEQLDMDVSRVN